MKIRHYYDINNALQIAYDDCSKPGSKRSYTAATKSFEQLYDRQHILSKLVRASENYIQAIVSEMDYRPMEYELELLEKIIAKAKGKTT